MTKFAELLAYWLFLFRIWQFLENYHALWVLRWCLSKNCTTPTISHFSYQKRKNCFQRIDLFQSKSFTVLVWNFEFRLQIVHFEPWFRLYHRYNVTDLHWTWIKNTFEIVSFNSSQYVSKIRGSHLYWRQNIGICSQCEPLTVIILQYF